jgi:hypothetical protein
MLFKGRFNGEIEIKTSTGGSELKKIKKRIFANFRGLGLVGVVLALISKIFEF